METKGDPGRFDGCAPFTIKNNKTDAWRYAAYPESMGTMPIVLTCPHDGTAIRLMSVDFLRNIVTARHTKNGRPRDIPTNDDVRQALADLCKDKRPDDYVFVSEKTGSCIREVKKGFTPRAE